LSYKQNGYCIQAIYVQFATIAFLLTLKVKQVVSLFFLAKLVEARFNEESFTEKASN